MDTTSVEKSLVQYHLLHFVIGAVLAAILLAVPKVIGVVLTCFLAALILPAMILPDFPENKWLDRIAVIVGAIAVGLLFFFLKKL
jgi:hypothetical protein